MELLETQNPERKRLTEASDRHKYELEREVNNVRDKTERILMQALIIGGSLALTYFVISRFTGSTKKKKGKDKETLGDEEASETPSLMSQIGHKVINQATLILLDIARQKLNEYLQSRMTNENS